MREIKFRAWTGNRMIDFEELKHGGYTPWNSTSLIWMQFTGLFDKNGKEIYDGDVVKLGGEKLQVRWSEDGWWLYNEQIDQRVKKNDMLSSEVIGNIYENSELLS